MMTLNRNFCSLLTVSAVIGLLPVPASGKTAVFVSIVPQKYFVHQIGKDQVDVEVMVQPGASPHLYEPRPQQMVAMSRTQIYFAVGVPFEKTWLPKIAASNPDVVVVHTDQGIQKISMAAHDHPDPGGSSERQAPAKEGADRKRADPHADRERRPAAEPDPHIWLSPPLVMIQARTIRNALQDQDPVHRQFYEANYTAFIARLAALDEELRNLFAGRPERQFMVYHPAWGYFANAYGLVQIPIEIEGKNPKPARLKKLIEYAKTHAIKFIFVQPQFSAKSATLIAREIDGQVVYADPLAEDWEENLHTIARQINAALR